jgi:hypothetical protein
LQLLPLILRSLSAEDPTLQSSTLETLHLILSDAHHLLQDHLQTIVPNLLSLTTYRGSAVLHVPPVQNFLELALSGVQKLRIQALQCLTFLTKMPYPKIFPYRV